MKMQRFERVKGKELKKRWSVEAFEAWRTMVEASRRHVAEARAMGSISSSTWQMRIEWELMFYGYKTLQSPGSAFGCYFMFG